MEYKQRVKSNFQNIDKSMIAFEFASLLNAVCEFTYITRKSIISQKALKFPFETCRCLVRICIFITQWKKWVVAIPWLSVFYGMLEKITKVQNLEYVLRSGTFIICLLFKPWWKCLLSFCPFVQLGAGSFGSSFDVCLFKSLGQFDFL